ncbi:MAG TPA: hypothetical protein VJ937_15520 [Salinivirga sp.]|uniref:hypothetical protein n=1 Tax=Salinivirga sp. TaxID=1970192 RepID=UPI002B4A0A78|nr:hypothetical protein [Salinivirga sp.]HKK60890.1 hypothetical protein [Salinivirga sp.]
MKSYKKQISLWLVALAQGLMITHAIVPHHHHNEGLDAGNCCESHHAMDLQFEHHTSDECCTACNFLNTLFSQFQFDNQFVQVEYQPAFAAVPAKASLTVFNEKPVRFLHLRRQSLRAPPRA